MNCSTCGQRIPEPRPLRERLPGRPQGSPRGAGGPERARRAGDHARAGRGARGEAARGEARVPRRRGSRDGRAGGGVRARVTERRAAESPPRSRPSRTSLHPIRWWSVGLAIVCGRRSQSLPREDTVVSALKRRSIDRDFPERGSQRFDRRRSPLQKQRSIEQCHLAIRPFLFSVSKTTEHRSRRVESPPQKRRSIDRDVREALIGAAACTSPSKSSGASIAMAHPLSPPKSRGASIVIHFAVSDGVTGDDGVSAPKQRSIDRWGTSTRSSHGWGSASIATRFFQSSPLVQSLASPLKK